MKILKITTNLCNIAITLLLLSSLFIVSCSKEDAAGGNGGTASTTIKITDAPVDDASVNGAFVTISDIKLDGVSIQGFTKTTVDLAAYQNGSTRTLGTFNLQGKTYSSISFVLDFDMDAAGNAPGCYILAANAVKHKLQAASNVITISKNFSLQGAASNSIVADFDLRKMIIRVSGGTSKYSFATVAELQNHIRLVVENQTGRISGSLTDNVSGSGKIIAYAYKKGTFVRNTELQGQGASNIQFSNAVTSSAAVPGIVQGSYVYQLHFLEAGDYEIHFASYKDTDANGEFELQGTLNVVTPGEIDVFNLKVFANTSLTVNAVASGVLP